MSRQSELAQLGRVFDNSALSNRNLIINGSHIVNQRGLTSVTTGIGSSTFTTDRWISYGNGQAVNITIQEVALPDGTVVNSHKTTATTSLSTVFLHPFQKVETFGKSYLRGKTITISTWVRTNMSGQRLRICDTVGCYTLGSEIPSDGAWHYVTGTHTMPSGMATGASDFIQIHPAFGTTNTVSGSYIEFTMTQFEVGDTATPFEHRSYGQELALCQRYFQRFNIGQYSPIGIGTKPTGTSGYMVTQLRHLHSPMRVTPTGSISSSTGTAIVLANISSGAYNATGVGVNTYSDGSWWLYGASNLPVRESDFYEQSNTGITYYSFDAEL